MINNELKIELENLRDTMKRDTAEIIKLINDIKKDIDDCIRIIKEG